MASISVVIPAYNEEGAIAHVLDALHTLPFDCEVIVVDDGSTDRTGDVARAHGARVLRHPMNCGYGRSIKDGISQATTDTIVLTDADGTYPIDRIPLLKQTLDEGFDMVVGARQGREYRGSLFKMPARTVFKWLAEFTTGRNIPDVNSGLRIFRRSAVIPYFGDLCNTFSFTTTITLVYLLTGKLVTYVPIPYHKRIGRSKVRHVRDSLRTLQFLIEMMASYNPLKLFLLLSGMLFLLSCALFVTAALVDVLWVIAGMVTLVGTFVLFGMGLVAHALKQPPHGA